MLVVLELTVVRLVFFFNWNYQDMLLTVIWVIGWSFLVLSALVACRVPSRWIGLLGAAILLTYQAINLVPQGGASGANPSIAMIALSTLLFRPGFLTLAPGVNWLIGYPLLPWFGIMALGYAFGEVLVKPRPTRIRVTAVVGVSATVAFVLLRSSNVFGNPTLWAWQSSFVRTVLSFINCQKQPPSPLYVLMTLGPGLLMLAVFDALLSGAPGDSRRMNPVWRFLDILGRVPLFFYILQWVVIHLLTLVVNAIAGKAIPVFDWSIAYPPDYGYGLPLVYVCWIVAVAALFGPCWWFAGLRRRRRDIRWLSYL